MRFPFFPKSSLASDAAVRGEVIRVLSNRPEVKRVAPSETVPSDLVVTMGSGPVNCHLSNLAKAVLAAQRSREAQDIAIHGFVQGLVETETLPVPSPRDLIVGVRNRAYVEGLDPAPLWRPFTGDLVVVLMQDLPHSVCMVTEDRLAEAEDLPPKAAWAAAYDGLSEMLLADIDIFEEPEGGFWVGSEAQPVLGNSALLSVPLLQHLRQQLGAQTLLIAASRRDGIEVADAASPASEARLKQALQGGLEAPYGQSSCLFHLSEDDRLPRPWQIYRDTGFGAYGD